jgi:hypothetical protein
MGDICAVGRKFKIGGAVVLFVSVDMVDLVPNWDWATERLIDDSVNANGFLFVFAIQIAHGVRCLASGAGVYR